MKVRALEQGITAIDSMRGHSSHEQNPFMVLKRKTQMKLWEKQSDLVLFIVGILEFKQKWIHDITRIQ